MPLPGALRHSQRSGSSILGLSKSLMASKALSAAGELPNLGGIHGPKLMKSAQKIATEVARMIAKEVDCFVPPLGLMRCLSLNRL